MHFQSGCEIYCSDVVVRVAHLPGLILNKYLYLSFIQILNFQNGDKWEGDFASTLSFKLPDYLKIVEFLENKPFNQKFFPEIPGESQMARKFLSGEKFSKISVYPVRFSFPEILENAVSFAKGNFQICK